MILRQSWKAAVISKMFGIFRAVIAHKGPSSPFAHIAKEREANEAQSTSVECIFSSSFALSIHRSFHKTSTNTLRIDSSSSTLFSLTHLCTGDSLE
jgi:hypothetical protein